MPEVGKGYFKVARSTPLVETKILTWASGSQLFHLEVNTPAWYEWLEESSLFAFHSNRGTFTARKEFAQHGGAYWKAYRKSGGKLHRTYLGASRDLTLGRLEKAASLLAGFHRIETKGSFPDTGKNQDGYPSLPQAPAFIPGTTRVPPPANLKSGWEGVLKSRRLRPNLAKLIGREEECKQLCGILLNPETQLVTLTGAPGVGKTHLALKVREEIEGCFELGACFVSLSSIIDPDLVLVTIARSLGVEEGGVNIIQTLANYPGSRSLLLILDTFDHLIPAAAPLSELLRACPSLTVLATSRVSLRVAGENVYNLKPLKVPDISNLPAREELEKLPSVRLFLASAQAFRQGFNLTEANSEPVAKICARLDGLPLALEMAAEFVKILPPAVLLERLTQPFRLLTRSAPHRPERQQTLHSAITWSYELLSSEEQRILRYLSVFEGGFDLETAEEFLARALPLSGPAEMDLLPKIVSLLDQSMIQQVETEDGEPFMVLLGSIREYGLECLQKHAELEAVKQAYARYYQGRGNQKSARVQPEFEAALATPLEEVGRFSAKGATLPLPVSVLGTGDEPGYKEGMAILPLHSLEINCFGQFRVYHAGKPVRLGTNRKSQEIFRYLVNIPRHCETNEVLMALLWPEDKLEIARPKLHIAISSLRKALLETCPDPPGGSYILYQDGTYRLNPSVEISTDATKFENLYRSGLKSGGREAIQSYEAACKLYTGVYLPEDRYTVWSQIKREQFAQTYVKMCRFLAHYYAEQKDFEEVITWAQAILREDTCDELAWQQLIWALGASGRRSEALHAYRRCARALAEELEIEPLPNTNAILNAIMSGQPLAVLNSFIKPD